MRVVGIDPGSSGAMVVLEDGVPIEWDRMPTMTVGKSERVNPVLVHDFLASSCCVHIFIEMVGAMPKQGVTSMFNFGHSVGTVMGVIGSLGLPYTLVPPQAWNKSEGLIGTEKDAARVRAMQLWPKWDELHKKIQGRALADAALIARHGYASMV